MYRKLIYSTGVLPWESLTFVLDLCNYLLAQVSRRQRSILIKGCSASHGGWNRLSVSSSLTRDRWVGISSIQSGSEEDPGPSAEYLLGHNSEQYIFL